MRKQLSVKIIYLLILGMTLGAVLVLGALVAPVIFNSESLLRIALLDHYNEGVLMAEIFRRFTYWGYVVVITIVLFEMIEYKQFRRDTIALVAAFSAVCSLLLFNAVYTPKILALQQAGPEATMSEAFENLHLASELDFKILAVALAVLFVRRVMLLRTVKA